MKSDNMRKKDNLENLINILLSEYQQQKVL